jgi:hypothetical protein
MHSQNRAADFDPSMPWDFVFQILSETEHGGGKNSRSPAYSYSQSRHPWEPWWETTLSSEDNVKEEDLPRERRTQLQISTLSRRRRYCHDFTTLLKEPTPPTGGHSFCTGFQDGTCNDLERNDEYGKDKSKVQ